jgi:hypothetical protein
MTVVSIRTKVVLPAPFGPISPKISLFGIERFTAKAEIPVGARTGPMTAVSCATIC